MKILWITYVVFPEALELLTGNKKQKKGSGGWLYSAAQSLLDNCEVELRIATVARSIPTYSILQGEHIKYYMIPFGKGFDMYHHGYDSFWMEITNEFKPDVVHIHGVESTLGLSYIRACGNKNVVVSIQGLTSIISRYYYDGLSNSDVIRNITIGDLIRRKTLYQYRNDFKKKGADEINTLKEVNHVIGRTNWDKDHVLAINPKLNYHFCNETLRDEFYGYCWTYENCSKHTIFLSTASAAFKGAHFVLKALRLIANNYPDVEIRIAGSANIAPQGLNAKLHQTGYEHYLEFLIRSLGISNHIKFLGALSATEMRDEYLMANLFICPSTIENSSNSVAEAQILGVPLIASYVGGVPDMVFDDRCGCLYRCEEYEMLASLVCQTFEQSKYWDNTFVRQVAAERHNKVENAKTTFNIYRSMVEQ